MMREHLAAAPPHDYPHHLPGVMAVWHGAYARARWCWRCWAAWALGLAHLVQAPVRYRRDELTGQWYPGVAPDWERRENGAAPVPGAGRSAE